MYVHVQCTIYMCIALCVLIHVRSYMYMYMYIHMFIYMYMHVPTYDIVRVYCAVFSGCLWTYVRRAHRLTVLLNSPAMARGWPCQRTKVRE